MNYRGLRLILLCSAPVVLAAQPTIHLQRGVYVAKGTPCKDAPFAAMKMWDGNGFSGAHSGSCVARVLHANGATFAIEDTCSALGDGTATKPDTEAATVTVRNARSFRYARSGTDLADYRWCARK